MTHKSTTVLLKANVKAIIWDLDGTILDSFEIYEQILAEAVVLHNLPLPEREVLLNNFHGSLRDSIAAALSLQYDEALEKLLNDFLKIQENFYHNPDSHLFTDAIELAQRVFHTGRRQFIVTNRAHSNRGNASPRFIVDHSRLRLLINDFVCGDESDYAKPDARVVLPLLERYGLKGNEILVIGDQHVDAELAHNCGASAIIVNRTGQPLVHLKPQPELQILGSLNGVGFA